MSAIELTPDQVRQFNRDGYIMVPNLFTPEMVTLLHQIAKADREIAGAKQMADANGRGSKIYLKTELTDNIYSGIAHSPRIVDRMSRLLGEEVYHLHHKMMLKEPLIGGAWEWHQDYGYWYNDNFLFPDMASCMIAVDRANKANGCLQVLKGSHRMGRIEHVRVGNQTGADPKRVEQAKKALELVYCEMEPGTGLFFHSNLLHSSDANTSEFSRWSFICCYATTSNQPFEVRFHGKFEKLERWSDEKIMDIGRKQLEAMQAATA